MKTIAGPLSGGTGVMQLVKIVILLLANVQTER